MANLDWKGNNIQTLGTVDGYAPFYGSVQLIDLALEFCIKNWYQNKQLDIQ